LPGGNPGAACHRQPNRQAPPQDRDPAPAGSVHRAVHPRDRSPRRDPV
jgi:hypothetical protein